MEEYCNQFKITCKHCNVFVTCSCKSGELLYITFLHAIMSTLRPYPEELVPETFSLQWPARTKMQRFIRIFWKKLMVIINNYDVQIFETKNLRLCIQQKYLIRLTLRWSYAFKSRPTGNVSVFITYSNTINSDGLWSYESGYLITQWQKFVKEEAVSWFKKLGWPKKWSKLVELVVKMTSAQLKINY